MNKDLILKKGDIVTYYFEKGNTPREMLINDSNGKTLKELVKIHNIKVIKIERKQTIYEYKEILDDEEREYLGDFIRPFKNKITYIEKLATNDKEKEWLCIGLKREQGVILPYFKANAMYKGMKLNKEYTLEELGL